MCSFLEGDLKNFKGLLKIILKEVFSTQSHLTPNQPYRDRGRQTRWFAFLQHYVAWFWEQVTSVTSQAADCLPLLKLSG